LLCNLPANLKLCIGSRTVPPFSLSRLKVAGQVYSLDSALLCFDHKEAEQFLLDRGSLYLEQEDMKTLLDTTEGWPAALQLALPSLAQHSGRQRFIEEFSGNESSVSDFLTEEVLNRLPSRMLDWLLEISIVDRFCVSLCVALTDDENVHKVLEAPVRDSLLLQRFESGDNWYRFHPLVRSFLRKRLEVQRGKTLIALHGKAASWFEQQGLISEAIEHLLKADEQDYALTLLDQCAYDMMEQGQLALLIHLVHKMPQGMVTSYGKILVPLAWAQLMSYRFSELKQLIAQVDTVFEGVDLAEQQSIALEISVIKASMHAYVDNFNGCQLEISRWPEDKGSCRPLTAVSMTNLQAYVHLTHYRFEAVYRLQSESAALYDHFEGPGAKAYSRWLSVLAKLEQLHWLDAKTLSDEAVSICTNSQGNGAVFRHQAELISALTLYYAGAIDEALTLFEDNLSTLKNYAVTGILIKSFQAMIRLYLHKQRVQKAYDMVSHINYIADFRRLPRLKACVLHEHIRILLLEGDYETAAGLFKQVEKPNEQVSVEGEEESITQKQAMEWHSMSEARLHLHANDFQRAKDILDELAQCFQSQGRSLSLLELRLLQAKCNHETKDSNAALEALTEALALPVDEQMIQPFVDEGRGMAAYYQKIAEQSAGQSATRMSESIMAGIQAASPTERSSSAVTVDNSAMPTIDPLSERELEVLRLVGQGLSNAEIANKLCLSIHAVKSRLKVVFTKMSVERRTKAVSLARDLKLID